LKRSPSVLDIIFLLAGSSARREQFAEHTRAALAGADFVLLERELAERRLLPLIGTRAIEAAPDLVPDSFGEAVARARAASRARGLAVEAATQRVARLLDGAGIRCLPLKGPLLAAHLHGDIGLRATNDVDVLVARRDLETALRTLTAAGFEPPDDPIRPDGMPDLHYTLRHPALPAVELHWRVHWDEEEFSARMLARAAPAPDGLLRAQPDDLAAALLLFYARDGLHGVRIAADIAAWADRYGATLPPRFLEPLARSRRELAPALTGAALAAERVCGVPALAWLGSGAAPARRVRLAERLADWSQDRDRDQMAANMSLASGLLGAPGSGRRFVRRELSLGHAGAAANAAHAVKLCARYLIALWSIRGGRRWVDPPVPAGTP
jgi:hypothetical protein